MKNKIYLSSMFFENEINFEELPNNGFNGIEFRSEKIIVNDSVEEIDKIKKQAKKHNIEIISIHAPFKSVDISSFDEYKRKKSIRDIEKAIVIANRLNAKYTVIHLSGKIEENNRAKRLNNAFNSLKEIKNTANMFGIEILIENVLKDMLISSYDEIDIVINKKYALCFDIGHALITKFNINDFYNKYKNHIKLLHYHVNNGINDDHEFIDKHDLEEVKQIQFLAEIPIVFEITKNNYSIKKIKSIFKEYYDNN